MTATLDIRCSLIDDVCAAFTPDEPPVAATYAGFGNTSYAGPTLVVTAVPVPEPETYALMLAGLGIMAGIARNRHMRHGW